MARLIILAILMIIPVVVFGKDEVPNSLYEYDKLARQKIYTEQEKQEYERKVNERLQYNCKSEIKEALVNLITSKKEREKLLIDKSLNQMTMTFYLRRRDEIDQNIDFYQWKYTSMIKQCQDESLINTEQLRDILNEVQPPATTPVQ